MTQIKEHPILFSTEMVKAILEGRKTVTRRIVDIHPELAKDVTKWGYSIFTPEGHISARTKQKTDTGHRYGEKFIKLKYGKPGDVLWVRETWAPFNGDCGIGCEYGCHCPTYIYKADYDDTEVIWKPSIHMPRSACRLRLEIVSITVERLQDITEEDAIKEGIEPDPLGPNSMDGGVVYPGLRFYNYADVGYRYVKPLESFQSLWTKINGAESWNANPWVWKISFKRI